MISGGASQALGSLGRDLRRHRAAVGLWVFGRVWKPQICFALRWAVSPDRNVRQRLATQAVARDVRSRGILGAKTGRRRSVASSVTGGGLLWWLTLGLLSPSCKARTSDSSQG